LRVLRIKQLVFGEGLTLAVRGGRSRRSELADGCLRQRAGGERRDALADRGGGS
jgi:hypothetical protein